MQNGTSNNSAMRDKDNRQHSHITNGRLNSTSNSIQCGLDSIALYNRMGEVCGPLLAFFFVVSTHTPNLASIGSTPGRADGN